MARLVHTSGLTCEEIRDRLSDYVDGELDPWKRLVVQGHLSACVGCERFARELVETIGLLRQLGRHGCD
jgi:anti-sigma factor RsiW